MQFCPLLSFISGLSSIYHYWTSDFSFLVYQLPDETISLQELITKHGALPYDVIREIIEDAISILINLRKKCIKIRSISLKNTFINLRTKKVQIFSALQMVEDMVILNRN